MFRDYDIRGIYPKEINENLAWNLAKKFYNYLKSKKINLEIFLGIDERPSSLKLANAFANSYLKLPQGKIKYLGIVSTPMFYYFCIKNKKAGAMITASHLPQNYNGFKLVLPDGLMWLYKGKLDNYNQRLSFSLRYKKIYLEYFYEDYIKYIRNFVKINKFHIISFKNNLKSPNYYLLKKISEVESKIKLTDESDLNIFSDLDGDRMWFKYQKTNLLPEHVLYSILYIGKYQKVGIPITIHKNIIKAFPNIEFIFIKTGHINFKKAFKKHKLEFAMEPSFHYYFFKEIKTEAPILSLLKLLEFKEIFSLDNLISQKFFVKRFTINKKINFKKIIKEFKKDKFKTKKFDGFYVYKKINNNLLAFHIRKSKTETNKYRLFLEASDKNYLKFIEKQIKKYL